MSCSDKCKGCNFFYVYVYLITVYLKVKEKIMNATNEMSNYSASVNAGINSTDTNRKARESDVRSWFEAMAQAWGDALDTQAARITDMSHKIGVEGEDDPSSITMLTAESLRMQFLSNNAATATKSVGQALEALARK